MVYRLIRLSIEYSQQVALCNAYNKYGRFLANDLEEYKNTTQELDNKRRIKHQALIASIEGVNRICEINELPLLYKRLIK